MVMLFTEEQRLRNKCHDDAWADIYARFPDAEHEERRALFLREHPDVNPDFEYPTRVPSEKYPNAEAHRRHNKIPPTWDEDVERFLGSREFTLSEIFRVFLNKYHQLDKEDIPEMKKAQDRLRILSHRLRQLTTYGTSSDSPTEAFAEKVDILVEFIDEAILLLEENGKVYIERDTSL